MQVNVNSCRNASERELVQSCNRSGLSSWHSVKIGIMASCVRELSR
jgi:hypothetical protein